MRWVRRPVPRPGAGSSLGQLGEGQLGCQLEAGRAWHSGLSFRGTQAHANTRKHTQAHALPLPTVLTSNADREDFLAPNLSPASFPAF